MSRGLRFFSVTCVDAVLYAYSSSCLVSHTVPYTTVPAISPSPLLSPSFFPFHVIVGQLYIYIYLSHLHISYPRISLSSLHIPVSSFPYPFSSLSPYPFSASKTLPYHTHDSRTAMRCIYVSRSNVMMMRFLVFMSLCRACVFWGIRMKVGRNT